MLIYIFPLCQNRHASTHLSFSVSSLLCITFTLCLHSSPQSNCLLNSIPLCPWDSPNFYVQTPLHLQTYNMTPFFFLGILAYPSVALQYLILFFFFSGAMISIWLECVFQRSMCWKFCLQYAAVEEKSQYTSPRAVRQENNSVFICKESAILLF